jgi:hypothetical protein
LSQNGKQPGHGFNRRTSRNGGQRKTMNLYSTLVFLHVLSAILGLGPLAALAIISSWASPSLPVERFAQLLRLVAWGLGAMLVTGVFIVQQTHGALGKTAWVQISFGLFLVLGALQGIVRRRVKRSLTAAPPGVSLPRNVSPLLWTMCGLVGAITYLMEAKPW